MGVCHCQRNESLSKLHQSGAASTWWFSPWLRWAESKWLLVSPNVPDTSASLYTKHFLLCCAVNDRRRAASFLFKICCLSFLLFLYYLSRFFILLFLVSGNVYLNSGVFCCVCSSNAKYKGRSAQCFTCSKSMHFRFISLFSIYSWSSSLLHLGFS